jgi:hypothetical protein
MKFSNKTIEVLKNFSTMNPGILFRPGTTLRTIGTSKNLLAKYVSEDVITDEFGIYDLSTFCNTLSFYPDHELEFNGSNKMTIHRGDKRARGVYGLTAASNIEVAPEKDLSMPESKMKYELSREDLEWMLRVAACSSLTHIGFVSDGTKCKIVSKDMKNGSSDTNSNANELDLGTGSGEKYAMMFKTENIKMLPGTYIIDIGFDTATGTGVAHFKNKDILLEYWAAIEAGSSYTKE